MTTIWEHSDIPKADLANEGGVELKRSKKPEQLMKRLLDFATNEGDYVIDIFGGSGTTFAVAQKMKRKWIGIEIGNHADSHIIPRLKEVIAGHDKSGITKITNWKGGGAFKYYHLGASIITKDRNGKGDFNWGLGKKFIEESLLSSYDYVIDNDFVVGDLKLIKNEEEKPTIGFQTIGFKTLAAVISLNEPTGKRDVMAFDEIQQIYEFIKKEKSPHSITMFSNRGIEIAYDSKPNDLEIIKVPNAIFAELEN